MWKHWWIIGALAAVGWVPGALRAEETDPEQLLISLDMENMDLRSALKALQKETGLNFIVHPEVKDASITAHFVQPRPLGTILKLLLFPLQATYEVKKGVFIIYPQPEEKPAPEAAQPTPQAPADVAEPEPPVPVEEAAPVEEEVEAAPPALLPPPEEEEPPEPAAEPAPEAANEEDDKGEEKVTQIRVIPLKYLRPSVAAWLLGGAAVPAPPEVNVQPFQPSFRSRRGNGGYGNYGGYGGYGYFGEGNYGPYGGYAGPGGYDYGRRGNPTSHGTSVTKTWGLFGARETQTVFGPDGTYTVEGGLTLDPNGDQRPGLTLGPNGFSFQLGPFRFDTGQARIEFPPGF